MRRPLMWIQSVTLVLPRMNQKMGDVLINMKLMLARRRPIWGYILVREKWQLRIGTSPILYWSTSIKTYSLTYQVKSAFSENFDNYYTIASITYVIIFIITTTRYLTHKFLFISEERKSKAGGVQRCQPNCHNFFVSSIRVGKANVINYAVFL